MDKVLVNVLLLSTVLAGVCSGYKDSKRYLKASSDLVLAPDPIYRVSSSETFQINCQFSQPVTCLWVVNGVITNPAPGRLEIINPDDPTDCSIRVTRVEEKHEGKWSCGGQISGSKTLTSDTFEVVIIKKADSVRIQGQPRQMKEDEKIEMTCVASGGKPSPDLKWLILNGTDILYELEGKATEVDSQGTSTSTLVYLPNYEHNGMDLGCAADVLKNNTYISEHIRIERTQLNILYGPRVSANTPNEFLVEGENAVVTIKVFSNPELNANNIRWKIRDFIIRPGQSKNGFMAEKISRDSEETTREDIFLVSLRISKLEQTEECTLLMSNNEFQQEASFLFRVALDTGGAGLSGAQVAAIVVPILIILVILIVGTVVAKRRRSLCFAPNFSVKRQRVATSDPDVNPTNTRNPRNNQLGPSDQIRNTKVMNAYPQVLPTTVQERAVTAHPEESPSRSEAATPPIGETRYINSDV